MISTNQTELQMNVGINKIENIPLDVTTELAQYSKIYVCKRFNAFRNFCCYDVPSDYEIFGVLPDTDKKLLFTAQKHFECCDCCDRCSINCCCCGYNCCDLIFFQMDYKRNGNNFYTHGFNGQKGCFCIKCYGCYVCCSGPVLFLREEINPDNADIHSGIHRGKTRGSSECCAVCRDRVVTYYDEHQEKGPKVKYEPSCCEKCIFCFGGVNGCCLLCADDLHMNVLNRDNLKIADIFVPFGCESCYCKRKYYEINFIENLSSIEKFQTIADVIHFNLQNGII